MDNKTSAAFSACHLAHTVVVVAESGKRVWVGKDSEESSLLRNAHDGLVSELAGQGEAYSCRWVKLMDDSREYLMAELQKSEMPSVVASRNFGEVCHGAYKSVAILQNEFDNIPHRCRYEEIYRMPEAWRKVA